MIPRGKRAAVSQNRRAGGGSYVEMWQFKMSSPPPPILEEKYKGWEDIDGEGKEAGGYHKEDIDKQIMKFLFPSEEEGVGGSGRDGVEIALVA